MRGFSWARSWLASFVVAGWIVIILGVFVIGYFGTILIRNISLIESVFQQESQRSSVGILSELITGATIPSQEVYRFLVLGTDEVAGSNRSNVLTDTIVVVSYRPGENQARILSVPRDLYLSQYGSRINALYSRGREQGLPAGELPEQAVEDLLGVPIDTTLVVSMEDVAAMIDIVGGIQVEVPNAFEDPLYPRGGVDVTVERNPTVLYETLRFEAGLQQFDGTMAVKYARTRHSSDPAEGSDQARIRRQQQVLSALIARLKQQEVLIQPSILGKLYRFYSDRFSGQVSLTQVGRLLRDLSGTGEIPELVPVSLSATDAPRALDETTVLVHPALTKYSGQWVYELADPTGQQLKQLIQDQRL